jgi:SulP family sulfate permease
VILFLVPLIALLPLATLAAVIIVSTVNLIDIKALKRLTALDSRDGLVAWTTFGISFLLKPDDAVFIGVFLALLLFLHRTMKAQVVEVGFDEKHTTLRAVDLDGSERLPHTVMVRPQTSLYYASIEHVVEGMTEKIGAREATGEKVHTLVIDASGINMIDGNAIDTLEIFFEFLEEHQIQVVFIYTRISVQPILQRAPFSKKIEYAHNTGEMRAFLNTRRSTLHV